LYLSKQYIASKTIANNTCKQYCTPKQCKQYLETILYTEDNTNNTFNNKNKYIIHKNNEMRIFRWDFRYASAAKGVGING
jgi:hypothetical protein